MIKSEWEDLIYTTKEFIKELENVQQDYFAKLWRKLSRQGISAEYEKYLYDWIFMDIDDDVDEFQDYLLNFKKGIK